MRICFINNIYSSKITGGAERLIKTLADFLSDRGHNIQVIDCNDAYQRRQHWPTWRRLLDHVFGFFNLAAYWRMRRLMRDGNFDLVWTHNITGFGMIIFLALRKVKLIHTCHDIQFLHPSGLLMYGQENIIKTFQAKVYRAFIAAIFPKNALVIFPSHWLKQLHKKYGLLRNNQSFVVSNPLAVTEAYSRQEQDIFTFLYLGQIEHHKGVDLLLGAFSGLKNDARLVLAGSGSLLEKLQKETSDPRVHFTGSIFHNPYDYLALANCLVIPSLCYENLPTVALEAARAGIPVIGSRLGGIGEAVGSDALLFEPTEAALAEKLNWAIAHQEALQSLAAQARSQLKILEPAEYIMDIGKAADIIF